MANTFRYLCAAVASAMLWGAPAGPGIAAEADIVATGLHFPEGAIFVGDTLYFVDYSTSDVLRLVDGKVERVWHQDGCGANGLAALHGELLVACYDGGTILRLTIAGQVLEAIRHDDNGGAFANPNDLASDGAGGVYFTTSGSGSVPGKVYYRDALGRVKKVADGIDYANGLAVSPDGKKLYLAESRKHRLLKFSIGAGGMLSDEAEFANLMDILADNKHDAFTPDGLRIDKQGRLFVELYEGGGFAVLTEDGKLVTKAELPTAHHASLAIAPDGKSLYFTATDDIADGSYRGEIVRIGNPLPE